MKIKKKNENKKKKITKVKVVTSFGFPISQILRVPSDAPERKKIWVRVKSLETYLE